MFADDPNFAKVLKRLRGRDTSPQMRATEFKNIAVAYTAIQILASQHTPITDKDLDKTVPKHLREQAFDVLEGMGLIERAMHKHQLVYKLRR